MKKLLLAIVVVLSLSLCLFGCKKNEAETGKGEIVESEEVISFTQSNVSVELYESIELSVQNAEGKTLIWRSANPERLSVSDDGVALAKMAGNVIVYVSDGEDEVSCQVTIVNSGYIPLLVIDLSENLQLLNGDDYKLLPYVTYNGVRYDNAKFNFTATGSVSVSEDGLITANSVGKGTVTVEADWNGVECETLTMEIEVSVI